MRKYVYRECITKAIGSIFRNGILFQFLYNYAKDSVDDLIVRTEYFIQKSKELHKVYLKHDQLREKLSEYLP
jgi:hypothetical protein